MKITQEGNDRSVKIEEGQAYVTKKRAEGPVRPEEKGGSRSTGKVWRRPNG